MDQEENKLIEERRSKLKELRAKGIVYPNDFRRKDHAASLQDQFGSLAKEQLEKEKPAATVAGRMMLKRVMGKASFATLQDSSGRVQAYVTQDVPGYEDLDVGNTTSYNVTGLSASTAYYYRVRAYNSGGTSPNSNVIKAKTKRH